MNFVLSPSKPHLCGVGVVPYRNTCRIRFERRVVCLASKMTTTTTQLQSLRQMSKVVADTGEIDLVKKYKPVDCTTNPRYPSSEETSTTTLLSLILKTVQQPEYEHFLQDAIKEEAAEPSDVTSDRPYAGIVDRLAILIGCELLSIIPGRVSTEVDAHLSYNTTASVKKALRLMELYKKKGISSNRIYIKIASSWEGIQACKQLKNDGIDCNMTLLFSFAQAVACGHAGAALISPFVGRILDWYKNKTGKDYTPEEDPGVISVKRIYEYYKAYGVDTIVMGASFRNAGEVRELAGCDNITIPPSILDELEKSTDPLARKLSPDIEKADDEEIVEMDEAQFRQMHDADEMAYDKLTEGIERFAADQRKLEDLISQAIQK